MNDRPTIEVTIGLRFPCGFCGEQLALGKMEDDAPCLLHYGTPCDTYLLTEISEFLTKNRRKLGILDSTTEEFSN